MAIILITIVILLEDYLFVNYMDLCMGRMFLLYHLVT